MGSNAYKGVMRKYHSLLSLGQRGFDALLVFGLLQLICMSYGLDTDRSYHVLGVIGAALTWIVMGGIDAYRPWRGSSLWRELRVLMFGWLLIILCLLALAWATKSSEVYSRVVIGFWFILTPLALMLTRFIQRLFLRLLRKSGHNTRRVVIVGAGTLGQQLLERIQQAEWMGVEVVGLFDDDARKQGKEVLGVPIRGKTSDVYSFVEQEKIDQVYLA